MTDDTTVLPERDVIQLSIHLSEQDRDRLRKEWLRAWHGPATPVRLRLIEEGATGDDQTDDAIPDCEILQCKPSARPSHVARMLECWHSLLLLLCPPLIALLRCSHGLLNRFRKHGERHE